MAVEGRYSYLVCGYAWHLGMGYNGDYRMSILRWDCSDPCAMDDMASGQYVSYDDYAELEAKIEQQDFWLTQNAERVNTLEKELKTALEYNSPTLLATAFDHKQAQAIAFAERVIVLEAKLATHEWQPIETAPKDGTVIIILTKGLETLDGRYIAGGTAVQFYRVNTHTNSCEYFLGDREPTHWIPRPPKPESESTKYCRICGGDKENHETWCMVTEDEPEGEES